METDFNELTVKTSNNITIFLVHTSGPIISLIRLFILMLTYAKHRIIDLQKCYFRQSKLRVSKYA